jgi:phosphoglycolate phosphatase
VSAERAITRLIVFDLDGTLVDASEDLTSSLNATFARLRPGTPALAVDAVRAMIGEGATVLVQRALAAARVDLALEDVLPVYMDCYAQRLLETTRPYPGIPELLDALRPRTLAVLTNKPGGMSRAVLDGLGLSSRFLRVYGGGDLATRKPDPEGLLRLMEEAGVGRAEALMVGDSAIDVRTARAAGVRVVGVEWGFDTENLRAESPDALVSRPAELLQEV